MIYSFALDALGMLYVSGDFRVINGLPASAVNRVSSATGAVDTSWFVDVDIATQVVCADANDCIYVGGVFASAGGQPRWSLAAFPSSAPRQRVHDARPRPFPFGGVR